MSVSVPRPLSMAPALRVLRAYPATSIGAALCLIVVAGAALAPWLAPFEFRGFMRVRQRDRHGIGTLRSLTPLQMAIAFSSEAE